MSKFLVDAQWVVYRTLYKMDWLSNSHGRATGMEYGFLRIMQSAVQFDKEIVLCWDSSPTKRKKIFEGYKKSRKGIPIESDRLNDFFEATKRMYAWAKKDGLEADDVIASLVEPGDIIYSRDKDMCQLVTKNVVVLYSWTHQITQWDMQSVQHKFHVEPQYMPIYQAITGDAVDDIPGCKGIGKDSTAWSITKNRGDIKAMYYDELSFGEALWILRDFIESGQYQRNLELVTLIKDPTVIIHPRNFDTDWLKDYFQMMEIFSLDICKDCGWMPPDEF